jgi:hypothetical protein
MLKSIEVMLENSGTLLLTAGNLHTYIQNETYTTPHAAQVLHRCVRQKHALEHVQNSIGRALSYASFILIMYYCIH